LRLRDDRRAALSAHHHRGGSTSQVGAPTMARMRPHETVRQRLEKREQLLAPAAMRSADTRGRARSEPAHDMRTEFQRDRDRIIHSKAFRRLKHKTQVFIAPTGDHYVTRLTHTLEVSQVARTIARGLDLNEDLAEAIALGHDLGHTPFGHAGEQALGDLLPEGFRHNEQSVRIVDWLEASGAGLNLTWEVREGILKHSKPREGIFEALGERYWSAAEWGDPLAGTLEGQIVRISDSVAYLNHDIADAVRAGLLQPDDLPKASQRVLGETHAERIDALVSDIVDASWDAAATKRSDGRLPAGTAIAMSPDVAEATDELREFLFENVYLWEERLAEADRARRLIEFLWGYYLAHPAEVAASEFTRPADTLARRVADYIAGMTDHYASAAANRLGFSG
jgi:dGTPase